MSAVTIFCSFLFLACSVQLISALEWSEPEKICVKAKDNNPGYWRMTSDGVLRAVKLTHVDGSWVTCDKRRANYKSKWGCGHNSVSKMVNIHITDNFNNNVFPISGRVHRGGWYSLFGRDANSPSLAFSALYDENALKVKAGDEVKIWYGEDLFDHTENDNDGMTCMKAQAFIAEK